MKKERDIEMILSNISIRPDEAAKKTAYERMIAHHAELQTEKPENKVINISEYDLENIAAAGLPPEEHPKNENNK